MAAEMKRCVIIGAAPDTVLPSAQEILKKAEYVICADGGLDYAKKAGISPDLVIGDFDSAQCQQSGNWDTVTLPREKDDTDLLAAVKEGFAKGYHSFWIFGALGGRLDHSYGNLSVLQYIHTHGGTGILEDEQTLVSLCTPESGAFFLNHRVGETVSVFPFGCSQCVVTYRGLKYPLKSGRLSITAPLGISNVIVQDNAEIVVEDGTAVVMVLKSIIEDI